MALGSTQPETELSISNPARSKARPERKDVNLTYICELSTQFVSFTPPQPVTGTCLRQFITFKYSRIAEVKDHV
jgi:hypothetical protein